jgi:hypothetical protein
VFTTHFPVPASWTCVMKKCNDAVFSSGTVAQAAFVHLCVELKRPFNP